jgi:hypothetical protein
VLKDSACFASEQLNSIATALAQTTRNLRRLTTELSEPRACFTESGIRHKIERWLAGSFVHEVLHYSREQRNNRGLVTFHSDDGALKPLWWQRLDRTVLLTNRLDWSAEQVVAGYSADAEPTTARFARRASQSKRTRGLTHSRKRCAASERPES